MVLRQPQSECRKAASQWQDLLRLAQSRQKVTTLTWAVTRLPWSETVQLLDCFRGRRFQLDVIFCTAALKSCRTPAAPASVVLRLFESIKNFGLSPDVMAFNTALSACAETTWEAALDLFESCPARRLQADVVTYATIVGACSNALQWQQAVHLFARAACWTLDAQLLGLGMTAWLRGKHWQRALDLFCYGTRVDTVDAALFSVAIAACQEGAQWEAALQLLDQMPPSKPQHRIPAYGAACSACERSGGQWPRALELASSLEREVTGSCDFL
eukprot:s1524_g9.t1